MGIRRSVREYISPLRVSTMLNYSSKVDKTPSFMLQSYLASKSTLTEKLASGDVTSSPTSKERLREKERQVEALVRRTRG
jgi:hypothetical protein